MCRSEGALPPDSDGRAHRRRQAPLHRRDVVRRRGDFPGEVLAFQNIERQTHALRAPALGTVVETPSAATLDPGEDDSEGGRMSGHFTCGACGRSHSLPEGAN